jgi:hypothetical protein
MFLFSSVHIVSAANPACYPMGTTDFFSRAVKLKSRAADEPLMSAGAKNDGYTSPLPHTSLWRGNFSVLQPNRITIVSDELRCGRNRRGLYLRYAHYSRAWKYLSRGTAGQR